MPFINKKILNKLTKFLFLFFLVCSHSSYAKKNNKADSLIKVIESNVPDSIRLNAIDKLCILLVGNDPEKMMAYAQKGLKLAVQLNNQKKVAAIYASIGICFKNQGQLDTAERCQLYAKNIFKEIKDSKGISRTLNNLGIIEKQRSHYSKALEYYFESLSNLTKEKNKADFAQTYSNIGIVFKHLNNFTKAEEYMNLALQSYTELKDTAKMGTILTNLGSLYRNLNKNKEALQTLMLALDYNLKGGGDLQNQSTLYSNLGGLFMADNDFVKGIFYYDKALEIGQKQNNKGLIGICYDNKAKGYIKLKQPEKAKEFLDKSFETLKDLKEPRILLDYYADYADYYVLIADFKSAYKFITKLKLLNDSIFSSDLTSQLTKMEKELQNEKKQREIELLKKNEVIQKSELNRQKIITYGLSVFVLIIIALSVFIYKNLREKKRANQLLEQKNNEINTKNIVIEEKNKDIIDSIKYARRLQKTILAPLKIINGLIPEAFIFFKPKDIVSGDFYWIEKTDKGILFAVIDCTGHGVPGAMMSIVGNNLLNKIVKERNIHHPKEILNELVNELFLALRQDAEEIKANDGMDITICHFFPDTLELIYAGAFNPLLIVRNQELVELKTDKFSIGKYAYDYKFNYAEKSFRLQKNDMIYLSTDGYADQFGGERGKKLMRKNFYTVLQEISNLTKEEQTLKLNEHFSKWKGEYEQVDDITVFGFRA